MGGTNSVLGVIDARGHVLARTSIKTQEYPDIRDYVDALYVEAVKIMEPLGGAEMFRGIGAGAPNSNYYTGNIEYPANLPWQGVIPFCDLMSARFGMPCHVTNDANAAALGEMTYGAARGMKNFIMITLGTGVGSGIVIDGKEDHLWRYFLLFCSGLCGRSAFSSVSFVDRKGKDAYSISQASP